MGAKKIVFCPAVIGYMKARSEELENLAPFSRFLLWALKNGHSKEDIITTIDLGRSVVLEELAYLQSIGLVGGNAKLTQAGLKYYKLSDGIQKFNEKKFAIILNTYNGNIEELGDNIILAENDVAQGDGSTILRTKSFPDSRIACKKLFEKKFVHKAAIPLEFRESLMVVPWIEDNREYFLKFESDEAGHPVNPLYYKTGPHTGILKILDTVRPSNIIGPIQTTAGELGGSAMRAIRSGLSLFTKQ